jgi:hypothetical protein
MGPIALFLVLVAAACLVAMAPATRVIAKPFPVARENTDEPSAARPAGPASLVFSDGAIVRRGVHGDTTLVDAADDLGVVRLVERSRRRLLFLFARRGSLTTLGVRLHGAPRAAVDLLTEGATLVPDGLLPEAPFEASRRVEPRAALELMSAMRRIAPLAVDRIVCATEEEVALTVSGSTLASGELTFDLDAPLVWRPLAFHEAGGDVGGVFQGTWVDQGEKRRVFVSPLPPLALWRDPAEGDEALASYRSTDPVGDARAMELATSPAADPPPQELRVPVDALLMFPLRRALARAHGAKREHAPWHRRPTSLKQAR